MKKLLATLAILSIGAVFGPARGEVVLVYTSAQVAPLVTANGKGIYPDVIDYLNRKKLSGLTFKLVYLPRKRLQLKVESGELDGIVIGMMPHWFDDIAQKKYLWTAPFAVDRYVVVLPAERSVNTVTPGALAGHSIGMVLGYSYPELDQWVQQQGLIRADAPSDENNLEKLRFGRVDSVAAAESVTRYYMRLHSADAVKFQMHVLPSRQTERRFLVPRSRAAIYQQIAPVIRKLADDPEWQRAISKYE